MRAEDLRWGTPVLSCHRRAIQGDRAILFHLQYRPTINSDVQITLREKSKMWFYLNKNTSVIFVYEIENKNAKTAKLVTQQKC